MAQDKTLDVEIITPQKVVFSGKAVSVSVPGGLAPFQMLVNHAPIISTLEMGIVTIEDENNKKRYFSTTEGLTEVRKNKVAILVETADDASNLDINEINTRLKESKDMIKQATNPTEVAELKKALAKAENQLKAFEKQKGL